MYPGANPAFLGDVHVSPSSQLHAPDLRETGWGNEVIVSCYMRLENSELKPPQLLNEIKNVCYGGCETDLNLKTTKRNQYELCVLISHLLIITVLLLILICPNPRAQSDAL